MIWIIVVVLTLVYYSVQYDLIQKIKSWRRLLDISKTLPGPPMIDLLKNTHKDRVIPWFRELRKTYGATFRIWFGKDLFVFLTDPDDVKDMLSNNFLLHKTRIYDNMRPWLGRGLLTSEGNEWRVRRKDLTPAFHFNILGGFRGPMNECSNTLIKKLDEVADGREFDIFPYFNLFSLDVISETAMGVNKNAQEKSDGELVRAIRTVCTILTERTFSTWKRFPALFAFSESATIMNKALSVIHNDTMETIQTRRRLLQDEQFSKEHAGADEEPSAKRRLAFLDMLLMAQQQGTDLTDVDIREEVDTFMFAGHDTVSTIFGFCTYLLSTHPDVQEKILEEARDVSDGEDGHCQYLDAVIKESLRLYPSVPFYSRKLQDDVQIGKTLYPVGTSITIVPFLIHMDPKYYPDPEKFDPNRFLDNAGRHPFAHVPFSAGVRNCIGQKFAMLEMRSTLVKLVRNFKILPAMGYNPQVTMELTIKSGNGILVRLEKRVSDFSK